MRFEIERTSDWTDEKPCEEAVLHEFRDSYSRRYKAWVVDIGSLEGLMEFCDKHGSLIVDNGSIEIYDDYRE